MPSALDQIGKSDELQQHWIKRLIAFIIDAIGIYIVVLIILLPFGIMIWIFGGGWRFVGHTFLFGLFMVIYATVFEWSGNATIGKRILNLRVIPTSGSMNFGKVLIRNITKIWWPFFLLDFLVGFVIEGDPRRRFMDKIAETTVERTDRQERFPGTARPRGVGIPLEERPPRRRR